MQASSVKIVMATVTAVVALVLIGTVGFTVDSVDERQGVMLDFSYYNVEWVELDFTEGMNGMDALDAACYEQGYKVVLNDDQFVGLDRVPSLCAMRKGAACPLDPGRVSTLHLRL